MEFIKQKDKLWIVFRSYDFWKIEGSAADSTKIDFVLVTFTLSFKKKH